MPQRIDVPGMGTVEFPDGMNDADMSAAIKKTLAAKAPGPSAGDTAIDAGKSLGAGLARGVATGLGTAGDILAFANRMGPTINAKMSEWTGGKTITGAPILPPKPHYDDNDPNSSFKMGPHGENPFVPTSAQIQGAMETVTGKFHEPTTGWGKYFNTGGEFLGNPITYAGPGRFIAKAAQAIPGAIGSEAAGQAAEGTAFELPARILGAVAGGKVANAAARSAERAAVPTIAELRQGGDNAYNAARGLGVEIRQTPLRRLAGDIQDELYNNGRLREEAPATYRALDRLGRPTDTAGNPSNRHVTVSDVESVRRQLQGAAGTNVMNRSEAAAARIGVDRLEEYMATTLRQNPNHAAINGHLVDRLSELMQEGRGNWRAMRAAQDIEAGEYRATNNAAAANSGGNINNAMRQQNRAQLNRNGGTRGLQDDEIAQMERVVRGTPTGNVARTVGNLLPVHGVGGALNAVASGAAGTAAFGPLGAATALAGPAVGKVARMIGNRSTANQLDRLDRLIRGNSPVGRAAPPPTLQQQPTAIGAYEASRHE